MNRWMGGWDGQMDRWVSGMTEWRMGEWDE